MQINTVREASSFAVARHSDAACQNQALLENIYFFLNPPSKARTCSFSGVTVSE